MAIDLASLSLWERARLLALILLAQAGWRPERKNPFWLAGVLGSLFLATWLAALDDPRVTFAWFAIAWAFYFIGNSLVLGTPLRGRLIARLGEERAFRCYEVVVGLMFLNQGLALGVVASLSGSQCALPIASPMALSLGLALAIVGLTVKVWATAAVGIDIYYFKDLFLGRPLGELVLTGPYRYMQNPMYGVGYLHAYGLAILARSAAGLVAVVICHLSICGFMLLVERPFVRRIHGDESSKQFLQHAPRNLP